MAVAVLIGWEQPFSKMMAVRLMTSKPNGMVMDLGNFAIIFSISPGTGTHPLPSVYGAGQGIMAGSE